MSLRAQELRIGNYVLYEAVTTKVTGLDTSGGVFIEISSIPVEIKEIQPIPLTEEWLLKFGFEKDEYEAKYHKSMQTYKLTNEGWQWENIAEYAWSSVSIKHVHELQNLHFALTGEELTIKE